MPMKSRATTRDARWYARDDAPRRWNAGENILARRRGGREVVREVATTMDGWMDSIEGRRYEETPRLTRLGRIANANANANADADARRYVRAHGLAKYRDNLRHLDVETMGALRREDLHALGIRDVADRDRAMRMAREARRDARTGNEGVSESERETEDGGEGEEAGDARVETIGGVEDETIEGGEGEDIAVSARRAGKSTPRASTTTQSKIRVSVRKRPLNVKETSRKERDICTTDGETRKLTVWEPKVKVDLTRFVEKHAFAFDAVFDESSTNDEVYASEVAPLVEFLLNRTNATCFAYGQTGSGKTYTMQPLPGRAARDVLAALTRPSTGDDDERSRLQLWVSAFEIYGGRVFDLLNGRRKLRVLEDSKSQICIVGLKEFCVSDGDSFDRLVEHSARARCVGSTGANSESSRSHAILQLVLKKPVETANAQLAALETHGEPSAEIYGKLSFIDLAGSERGADTTDNDRQTRIEGAEINKSLLALKECIRALDSGASHVPFRGSKLTEVLRDSFLGDSRTVMIANISPAERSCEHTLNTLRYADRVKEISKSGGGQIESSTSASVHRESRSTASRRASTSRAPTAHASQDETTMSTKSRSTSAPGTTTQRTSAVSTPTRKISSASMSRDEAERAHDALIDAILSEEDVIIAAHREHIERSMETVKHEMDFLANVDKPGSAVDVYVDELDAILAERAEDVARLRARVDRFRSLLAQEESLSARVLATETT